MAVKSGRALISPLVTTRTLLAESNVKQARSTFIASREFADAIVRMMPCLTVVEEMEDVSEGLVQARIEALLTDLQPIFASIKEMTVFAAEVAHKTRGLLKQTEDHAISGDNRQAAKTLRETASELAVHTIFLSRRLRRAADSGGTKFTRPEKTPNVPAA